MSETPEETPIFETTTVDIPANPMGMNAGMSGTITKISPDPNTANLPDWAKQASDILPELPSYVGKVFTEYKSQFIVLGAIFSGFVGIKLVAAVLSAVNEIPLLAPTFELVGVGYTTWFVSRYLLQATTREELFSEINSFKSEIVGKKDS